MIPKEFTITQNLYRTFEDDMNCLPPDIPADAEIIINSKTGNFWDYDLSKCFQNDYEYLLKNKEFFIGCNLEIYNKHYFQRLQEYLKNTSDALEIDFIINDYNSLQEESIFSFASESLKENIKVSMRRIKEFLDEKIRELGFKIDKQANYKGTSYIYSKDLNNRIISKEILIDLSEASAVQKIIYIQKLGILDFLRNQAKNGISNNKLATVLSAITGEKVQTIQPMINPIGNPSVNQRNNPLVSNEKQVEVIKNKLIDYGFDI